MINFNQPHLTGKEAHYMYEAVFAGKLSGNGKFTKRCQAWFEERYGFRKTLLTTSGTDALEMCAMLCDLKPGDEVIVPSYTFVSTALAFLREGAKVVFADSMQRNPNLDAETLEALITPKTKAIMVMHFGGFACDMDRIMAIAAKHHLYVVEDACHGPLSEYHGRKLGTIGDVGCFSFFSNKNISTGEGGMVVTKHEKVGERIKLARSHGMTTMSYERAKGHSTSYDVVMPGYNYRLDDIRATLGIVQMQKLRADLETRQQIRALYEKLLGACEQVIVPFAGYTEFASNYIMPVILKDSDPARRDEVRTKLQEKGIQTSVHYPAVHRFSIYRDAKKGDLPLTEYASDCGLTLPMYAKLTEEEVTYICDSLKEILKG